jgi:putative transposase
MRGAGKLCHKGTRQESYLEILNKAMRKYGNPEVIVTDWLASYGAALKEIGAEGRQETGR